MTVETENRVGAIEPVMVDALRTEYHRAGEGECNVFVLILAVTSLLYSC